MPSVDLGNVNQRRLDFLERLEDRSERGTSVTEGEAWDVDSVVCEQSLVISNDFDIEAGNLNFLHLML